MCLHTYIHRCLVFRTLHSPGKLNVIVHQLVGLYTETKISSRWRILQHCMNWELFFWQFPVQLLTEISIFPFLCIHRLVKVTETLLKNITLIRRYQGTCVWCHAMIKAISQKCHVAENNHTRLKLRTSHKTTYKQYLRIRSISNRSNEVIYNYFRTNSLVPFSRQSHRVVSLFHN